jgi:hypothetical protein
MPYRELLDENFVDMSTTMGVQNPVMRAIGDIATLSTRMDIVQSATKTDFLTECRSIENGLRKYHESPLLESTTDKPVVPRHSEKVRQVTRVFATAALVQLYAVIPGYKFATQSTDKMIEENITAIKSIQNPQDFRGLIWPICIAGSMAHTSGQQGFYETKLKSALNGAPRDFGNCATLLNILESCWNSRRKSDVTDEKDWRHAMVDIGTCLLV